MKRAAALIGLGVIAIGGPAGAFGTIRHLGQNAEHERITRRALQCTPTSPTTCIQGKTLDELAGRTGTFGAVGFPDNPRSGLISETKAHCDSGDTLPVKGYPQTAAQARVRLESCRAWMVLNLDQAVAEAARLLDADGNIAARETRLNCRFGSEVKGAKCRVLQRFGTTLHGAQDFYSHSNWVDRPRPGPAGPGNPPDAGPQRTLALDLASQGHALPGGSDQRLLRGLPRNGLLQGPSQA